MEHIPGYDDWKTTPPEYEKPVTRCNSCGCGLCDGDVIGTGHAYEKEDSSFINKTSYIENCETSAVGRALGMCGIGIDTSVASADEVLTAIKQQESAKPIGQAHINTLRSCILKHGQTEENVCKFFGVHDLSELSIKHFDILMKKMGEK